MPQWHGGPDRSTTSCPISPACPSWPRSCAPPDDDAGADADPAEDVDDVVAVAGVAAPMLGEHGQVGVVADQHRQAVGRELGQRRAERRVVPAEVGGDADPPGVPVDRARAR